MGKTRLENPRPLDPLKAAEWDAEKFNAEFGVGSPVLLTDKSRAPGRPGFVMGAARVITQYIAVVDLAGQEMAVPVRHLTAAGTLRGTFEEDINEAFSGD